MDIKIGDTIYEDFTGNNQICAGILLSKVTRVYEGGVFVSDSKEYPDEELYFPFDGYGVWWFSSLDNLYKNRINNNTSNEYSKCF